MSQESLDFSRSGYERAPATRLLATSCVVCRRPLVDAVSVEAGMGPDCRRKHGYEQQATEDQRTEANELVHSLALWRSKQLLLPVSTVALYLNRIEALGFGQLVAVLEEKLCTVIVSFTREPTVFALFAPYNEGLRLKSRALGMRWDPAKKAFLFNESSRKEVYRALREVFPSTLGHGPKGLFVVEPL